MNGKIRHNKDAERKKMKSKSNQTTLQILEHPGVIFYFLKYFKNIFKIYEYTPRGVSFKKNFTSNLSVRGPLRVLCILKQNRGYPVEKFSEFFNLLKSSEFLVVSITNNNLAFK